MQFSKLFEYMFSIPKSFLFCLHVLPIAQAIKLPIFVRFNTKTRVNRGSIVLRGGHFACVRIGFGQVGCFDKKYQRTILDISGTVNFNGNAFVGHGSRTVVDRGGVLEIGDNFENTSSITIICFKKIRIGDNVLTSWDTLIMDTDFHYVIDAKNGKHFTRENDIIIKNHVWVGCRCTILKGSEVSDNSVVAANSVVTRKFDESEVLLAGNPAIIKKKEISWSIN